MCIFGTSGGGKTTMLNIIGTIDKPTKGEMILCGKSKFIIFSLWAFIFFFFMSQKSNLKINFISVINHKTDDLTLAMIRLKKMYASLLSLPPLFLGLCPPFVNPDYKINFRTEGLCFKHLIYYRPLLPSKMWKCQ